MLEVPGTLSGFRNRSITGKTSPDPSPKRSMMIKCGGPMNKEELRMNKGLLKEISERKKQGKLSAKYLMNPPSKTSPRSIFMVKKPFETSAGMEEVQNLS